MSDRVSEIEKKEAEPERLTMVEAKAEQAEFVGNNSLKNVGNAKYIRSCYRVSVLQLHTYFKCKTEEDYVAKLFPGEKTSLSTFRDAKRIYKSFLSGAMEFPEFKNSPKKAGDFVEKKLKQMHDAVENKSDYVSELARTKIIGETKERAEKNIAEVPEIYRNSKVSGGSSDFIKKSRVAFGEKHPLKVAHSKKRTDRLGGSKVGVNARMDSAMMAPVIEMFDAVSKENGITKPYAELTSDDLGNSLYNVAMKSKALYPKSLKTQGERKSAAGVLAKAMVKVLIGAELSDAQLDELMEELMPIVERVSGEG